jgi:trimeric autotransporter adhesin
MKYTAFLFLIIALFICSADAQIIRTIAGNGTLGFSGDGGAAINAEFNGLGGMCFDIDGNLYVADYYNNRIRKISTAGIVTTIAGISGGPYIVTDGHPATNSALNHPTDVAVDSRGNVYIADEDNDRIRMIDTLGIMHTAAGGGFGGDGIPAISASLAKPTGVAVDNGGNIYIADGLHNLVRMVDTFGIITTIAGTGTRGSGGYGGPATAAKLAQPWGIRLDKSGNIYVSVYNNVKKISLAGIISNIAGIDTGGYNGDNIPATNAKLFWPSGISVDDSFNIYIPDARNQRVRKVDKLGIITTIAGNGTGGYNGDGIAATDAQVYAPQGTAIDSYGNIYISDGGNGRVRSIRSFVFVPELESHSGRMNTYPNPNKGHFIATVISAIDERIKLKITNIAGNVMKELDGVTNKAALIDFDAPDGIYFVTAIGASNVWSSQILLSK